MITSMTGFGRGESSSEGITLTAEIKSVNSRYLDISLRIPQAIQDKELELKERIQAHVNRGKLNLSIHLDQSKTGLPDITFDEPLVKGYKVMLDNLRRAAGIEAPVTLQNLMQFNDIFIARKKDEETVRLIWQLTLEAADDAIRHLNEMRKQEGTQLQNDLADRIANIEELMRQITVLTENRAPEVKQKLLERINSLITDEKIDPDRIEMEVAMLADKMDITEEIVRLQSHLKFFSEAIEQEESVGRRLNFLAQEMNREINTIGSKANNSEISQYVVQAKENLEQIREQIQNVE